MVISREWSRREKGIGSRLDGFWKLSLQVEGAISVSPSAVWCSRMCNVRTGYAAELCREQLTCKEEQLDAADFFIKFQDYLAPKLDTYEQAIYLYVFRHSRLIGLDEVVIGFKSARKKLPFGVGTRGSAPSEGTVYEKLRTLESKGCVKIISSERTGTRIRLFVPNEISGVLPQAEVVEAFDIETADFFNVPERRRAILQRDGYKCFYCLRAITDQTNVIEHVVSRPIGDNSFRNLVASCRQCNNRKGATSAEDFLRVLYREALLTKGEFDERINLLERLRAGDLRPVLNAA